jgi:hypothetical protein
MQSIVKVIRIRSEDSAYLYALLEGYEGLANCSTRPHQVGDRHRDIELRASPSRVAELEEVLSEIRKELEDPLSWGGAGYLIHLPEEQRNK